MHQQINQKNGYASTCTCTCVSHTSFTWTFCRSKFWVFYGFVLVHKPFNLPTLSPTKCGPLEPVKSPVIKIPKILSASSSDQHVHTTHYIVVANANNKMKSCFMQKVLDKIVTLWITLHHWFLYTWSVSVWYRASLLHKYHTIRWRFCATSYLEVFLLTSCPQDLEEFLWKKET